MPMHFDRFRFLNEPRRVRNEGTAPLYVRFKEEDEPFIIPPGEEVTLLEDEPETIVDVPREEPIS